MSPLQPVPGVGPRLFRSRSARVAVRHLCWALSPRWQLVLGRLGAGSFLPCISSMGPSACTCRLTYLGELLFSCCSLLGIAATQFHRLS